MTELMRLYLEVRKKNPTLNDDLARRQALIYFQRRGLPFNLSDADKAKFTSEAEAAGIRDEIIYIPPVPPAPTGNLYIDDEYIEDGYFE